MHALIPALAVLVFMVAWLHMEQAPTCVQCSSKYRHRPDCPSQK